MANIADATPITLPLKSSIGPPLLPGFMAASVCIAGFHGGKLNLKEDTIPVVIVAEPVNPRGYPITINFCPKITSSSFSNSKKDNSDSSIFIKAKSISESLSNTCPEY